MLGLKGFVQEAVRALEPPQLRLLADTLRVDLRGCEDRQDTERVLTGLLCLDQDTALGVFVAWLRATEQQPKLRTKAQFQTTFVPALGPPPPQSNQPLVKPETRVKDHHLDAEIASRLEELAALEQEFKTAERGVHTGSPSFDKLKAFLVRLTVLRKKEEETRGFLLKQSQLLREQHDAMQLETLHTREQLDFFVEGFANLRHRHDALLEASTRMKAENETAQSLFLSMSAADAHWAELLGNTLQKQLDDIAQLHKLLEERDAEIQRLLDKQREAEATISGLKAQRGDARKDAHCFRQQIRVCKRRMAAMEQRALDANYLRTQTLALRQAVTTLLGQLRDTIQRDTKSAKQNLSKEALRIIQRMLTPEVEVEPAPTATQFVHEEPAKVMPGPRVVKRVDEAKRDLTELVRGVVLLGDPEATAACAQELSARLKYVAIDVAAELGRLHRPQQDLQLDGDSDGVSVAPASIEPPTIASHASALGAAITARLAAAGQSGFVLFNWNYTAADVNRLKDAGLSIDSILDLKAAPPPSTKPASVTASANGARKPQTATSGSASPTKATPPSTPKASPSRASAAKTNSTTKAPPTAPGSRQSTSRGQSQSPTKSQAAKSSEPKKPTTPSSATKKSATPQPKQSAAPQPPNPAQDKTVDNRAESMNYREQFRGQLQLFHTIEHAQFVSDRVSAIIAALETQRARKLAPRVKWDDESQRTQEQLAMWGEEILMLLWIEQESRQPATKRTTPDPGSSSPGKATPSASGSRGGSKAAPAPSANRSTSTAKAPGASPSASNRPRSLTARETPSSSSTSRRATNAVTGANATTSPTRRLTQQVGGASSPPGKTGAAARQ